MTVVRRERSACLRSSVTVIGERIAVQQLWLLKLGRGSLHALPVNPDDPSRRRSVRRGATASACSWRRCLFPVHDRQGPAPAGQLPGYPDRGDGGAFLAGVECPPPLVQPAVGLIGASPHDRRLTVPATDHVRRQSIRDGQSRDFHQMLGHGVPESTPGSRRSSRASTPASATAAPRATTGSSNTSDGSHSGSATQRTRNAGYDSPAPEHHAGGPPEPSSPVNSEDPSCLLWPVGG